MNNPYFFFTLNQNLSAIKADYMEEVFSLPELILIPNAPLGIVGVIDLRGEVLPILDLQLIANSRPEPYQLTDNIVVVSHAELRIGIVAKSIQGLRDVASEDINTDPAQYQEQLSPEVRRFISGQGLAEEPFFVLSEPQNWFSSGEIQQVISVTSFLVNEMYGSSRADAVQYGAEVFEPNNSIDQTKFPKDSPLEAQTIFRQRAKSLRQSLNEDASIEGANTFVIVSLNDKFFGIESQIIREFITVTEATPIPCCPNHIIGNVNLRGEILTIIDIGKALDLELNRLSSKPKAIVAELDNMTIGIVVEDIQDAMFTINPKSVQGISDPALAVKRDHIRGAIPYQHQTVHILDLSALLKSEAMVVNERV